MQLTAAEIKDLAEMAGFTVDTHDIEMDQEFTVDDCPATGVKDDDGTPRHYAHIAWDSEYPEEGVMPLGAELPKPYNPRRRPDRRQTVAARTGQRAHGCDAERRS